MSTSISIETARRLQELYAWAGREWNVYDLAVSEQGTTGLYSALLAHRDSAPYLMPTLADLVEALAKKGSVLLLQEPPYGRPKIEGRKWECGIDLTKSKEDLWNYLEAFGDTPEAAAAACLIAVLESDGAGQSTAGRPVVVQEGEE